MSTPESEELSFAGLSWMQNMEMRMHYEHHASAEDAIKRKKQRLAYLGTLPKLGDSFKSMSDAPKEIQEEYNNYIDMEV